VGHAGHGIPLVPTLRAAYEYRLCSKTRAVSKMRFDIVTFVGLLTTAHGAPTGEDVLDSVLDLLPRQANVTCPPTPDPMPKAAAFSSVKTMPDPFLYLDGKTRVQSKDEWYQCRQPEILKLLQEYQYGYYPDHAKETVTATRSGTKLDVSVATGGKTATISATVNLPSGSGPFPVVIAIGGIDNNSYLKAGIAVVTFDYGKVAADSNSKTGSFWALYNGKDIGRCCHAISPAMLIVAQASSRHGPGVSIACSTVSSSKYLKSTRRSPVSPDAHVWARRRWQLGCSIPGLPSPCRCVLESRGLGRIGTASAAKAKTWRMP